MGAAVQTRNRSKRDAQATAPRDALRRPRQWPHAIAPPVRSPYVLKDMAADVVAADAPASAQTDLLVLAHDALQPWNGPPASSA